MSSLYYCKRKQIFWFTNLVCKAGDGISDVQMVSDLHKSEVFKVGAKLGVPASILEASPSADLWQGQTTDNEVG